MGPHAHFHNSSPLHESSRSAAYVQQDTFQTDTLVNVCMCMHFCLQLTLTCPIAYSTPVSHLSRSLRFLPSCIAVHRFVWPSGFIVMIIIIHICDHVGGLAYN